MVPERPVKKLSAGGVKLLSAFPGITPGHSQEKPTKLKKTSFTPSSLPHTLPNDVENVRDEATYASLLRWCGHNKALSQGRDIHHAIVRCGLSRSHFLQNHLLYMYGKLGQMHTTFYIFGRMRRKDVFSWNFMIKACVQEGHGNLAIDLFNQMQRESIMPDNILIVNLLPSCECSDGISKLHARLIGSGYEEDLALGTTLIKLYGKYGCVDDSRNVFNKMVDMDTMCWTAMIAVYAQHKQIKEAMEVFEGMIQFNICLDDVTFLNAVSACASCGDMLEGMKVHFLMAYTGVESNQALDNAVLHMYSKFGTIDDVWYLFRMMDEPDVVSWTAMITSYVHQGSVINSFQVLNQMHEEGILPNKLTFMSIISVCTSPRFLKLATHVHSCIAFSEYMSEVSICNALINMYGKCGDVYDACGVFENMRSKDVVSWNTIIHVCTNHEQGNSPFQYFKQMQNQGTLPDDITFVKVLDAISNQRSLHEGKQIHACIYSKGFESNIVVATALVNMYGRHGCMKRTSVLFDEMYDRDTIAWNAMIELHAQEGEEKYAFQVYEQMQQEGVLPEKSTYVSILSTCRIHSMLTESKCTHARIMVRQCGLDLVLGNALLNTYAKCGHHGDARKMFQDLHVRDVVSWNTLIAAYSQNGKAKKALETFLSMRKEGVSPNGVTFINILSACSHCGLIDEACQILLSMHVHYSIKPNVEHYNCLIDLLGRMGRLDEAEKWLHEMPMEPTYISWFILLNSCKHYLDVKRAQNIAEQMFVLDPNDVTPYILLSNIYCDVNIDDDAFPILHLTEDEGLSVASGHTTLRQFDTK